MEDHMDDSSRRSMRFPQQLPVSLGVFGNDHHCITNNVSRHGVHLEGAHTLAAGKMVWLHITLPNKTVLEATAIPRERTAGEGGWGLEFSMFLHGGRSGWEDFIGRLEREVGIRPEERRTWPRLPASYMLRLDGRKARTTDVSASGLFVRTASLLPIGRELELVLLHPTTGEHLPLRARVARHQTPTADKPGGMGLSFVGLDPRSRRRLMSFVTKDDGE